MVDKYRNKDIKRSSTKICRKAIKSRGREGKGREKAGGVAGDFDAWKTMSIGLNRGRVCVRLHLAGFQA